uniref:CdvA-like coiled-coil domain-containing protein n=1 Tax=Ignisphaera aggregans TaxID=334771 RepID=A0A7C2ZLF4_9CREN
MSITLDKIAPYLGQTIQDIYGRKVGVLVGIYSEVDGTVNAVEIMVNDFNYETVPAEKIELKDDIPKIVPEWLVVARKVEKKLDTLRKRIKALDELYKKGDIPNHAYQEFKEKFDKELNKIKNDVKNIKEVMRKRLYELENFVMHIEKAMTNLMITYTSGEVPENGFRTSADFMRFAKQTSIDEKKDLEKHTNLINKLEEDLRATLSSLEQEEESGSVSMSVANQQSPITVKITG